MEKFIIDEIASDEFAAKSSEKKEEAEKNKQAIASIEKSPAKETPKELEKTLIQENTNKTDSDKKVSIEVSPKETNKENS